MAKTLKLFRSDEHRTCRLVIENGWLKVIKQAPAEELKREADALEKMSAHGGLPLLLERGGDRLVRSFVPGRTLRSLLQEGSLPRGQLAHALEDLARLLRDLHARGLWHGDVSPSNVLVTPEQGLVLLDWGGPEWGTPPYSLAGLTGPEADWHGWRAICQECFGSPEPPPGNLAARLLGRDRERARLGEAWEGAAFAESTWVGVSAPSGGGKTALLRELLWWTPHYAWGQGSLLTTPVTYRLFQSLLEGADWEVDRSMMEESRWRQMLATFPILSQQADPVCSSAALSQLLIGEGWTDLIRAQCLHAPLLLIFDDVQWMDESSRDLLRLLSHRPIPGLMVVLAWREDEFELPEGIRLDFELSLPPLSPQDVQKWAQRESLPIESARARQVTDWTRGNPLLISEWLRQPDRPEFSERVGWLFQDRVREIPPDIRRVLQVGALMGREFELAPLQKLVAEPEKALAWAEQQQLLLPGPRFSHDKVREALLEELDENERRQWHGRLAAHFAEEGALTAKCAFHFWQAGLGLEALPFAVLAARQDRQRAAYATAAYYLDIACQAGPTPELLFEHAEVLRRLGQNQEALGRLEQGLQIANSWSTDMHLLAGQICRSRGEMVRAFDHVQEAWKNLILLPAQRAEELTMRVLSLTVEVCHEELGLLQFMRTLGRYLPWVFRHYRNDNLLRANLTLAAGFLSKPTWLRRLRAAGLRKVRQESVPLVRAGSLQRHLAYKFGEGDGRLHDALLESLVPVFIKSGIPWELSMLYFQQGLYVVVQGDFTRLRQLAAKIAELSRLGQDESMLGVTLYFETLASGARVSWQRLSKTELSPKSDWYLYRIIPQAIYLLRLAQPEQAYTVMKSQHRKSANPIEVSQYQGWLATVCGRLAESIPRRWRQKRDRFFEESRQAAAACLKTGDWGRLFHHRARREMALALVGLGRPQEAFPFMQQAVEQARAFGATYELALSLQAWGRVGPDLDWPESTLRAEEGRELLTQLGAWWELAPESPGLPLQEVGEAARQFLLQPDDPSRQLLARLTGSQWVAQLEEVRQRSFSVKEQLLEASQQLRREMARWQSFLLHGPVAVSRFDAKGSCLEGSLDSEGVAARVGLEGGEYAILTLPIRRSHFAQCQTLIADELAELTGLLQQHLLDAQNLPEHKLKQMLVTECSSMLQWHLSSEGVRLQEAWFVRDLQLRQEGEIPWTRLGLQARTALLCILREALQNSRKHRPGSQVLIQFRENPRELIMQLLQQGGDQPLQSASAGRSFGIPSMKFRASLAGGEVGWDVQQGLCLRLPLLS